MSFTYQQADFVTDANVIKANMVLYLESYMPSGWSLAPGSLLDLVLEALALQHAQNADVAQTKLDSDFRYIGSLFNIPPIDAVPPTSTATFAVQDTVGYTIPAGTVIGISDSSGVLQGFDLLDDLVIPATFSTGTGTVVAETAGTDANGLSGTAQLVSAPPFVTGATMTAAVFGIDAELDSVFLNRLVETIGVLRLIPVLGSDFAVLARSIPGIFRATGVNLLKPGPPYDGAAEATGVDKNVTVAVTDINGAAVGSTIRAQAKAYLQTLREQNFVIWVVDPQFENIDITATGVASWPGWDPAAVRLAVVAALTAALSPATFATDPSGNAARWANDPVLRASLLYQTIMEVPGVRYTSPPTFGTHGGALATTDHTLGAGSAIPALPTPGTITVTVTATTS